MHETATALLREAKRDAYGMAPTLGVLAVASYEGERACADRYGDLALESCRTCCALISRRLRPYFDGKLALLFSLIVAGRAMKPRALNAKEVISWLVGQRRSEGRFGLFSTWQSVLDIDIPIERAARL